MNNGRLKNINRPKFLGRIFKSDNNEHLRRSSQAHILKEELRSVLPIGGRSRNHQGFDIELIGKDSEIAIITLSSLERVNRRNVKESVCDIVNVLAHHLASSGFIRYEIVEQEEGRSLHYIPEMCFYDLGIAGVQLIPKDQQEHVKKAIIARSKEHIWKLTFPQKICNWKRYRNILDALAKNTSLIPPQIDQSELYKPSIGFDMNKYNNDSKKYIYSILNGIGGVQRETTLSQVTEFYLVNRMVRLNLSKALLREHIIYEINQLFKRLKINSNILIKGLPSSHDIREVLNELQAGKLGIDEALTKSNL